MKFRKFRKIGQLRNVVRDMDFKINVTGKVKVHGSNTAICFNEKDEMWFQSRKQLLTITDSHSHFPLVFSEKETDFIPYINRIRKELDITFPEYNCYVYGEWAGPGIQKRTKTAISQLKNKKFFAFAVYIVVLDEFKINHSCLKTISEKDDEPETTTYFTYDFFIDDPMNMILNINNFQTWKLEFNKSNIDFQINQFIEITNQVEKECPVAKQFGIFGIGEGVVWTDQNGNLFKVKGKKHSVTKVKTLTAVDPEKLKSIHDFVEYSVTENRVEQAVVEIWGNEQPNSLKLGLFVSWILKDIHSEEYDVLNASGLKEKDINKYLVFAAKEILIKNYNLK